jgi:hypothetical protein
LKAREEDEEEEEEDGGKELLLPARCLLVNITISNAEQHYFTISKAY